MFVYNFLGIVRFHLYVESVVGHDFHDRSFLAETETTGCDDLNFVLQVPLF